MSNTNRMHRDVASKISISDEYWNSQQYEGTSVLDLELEMPYLSDALSSMRNSRSREDASEFENSMYL